MPKLIVTNADFERREYPVIRTLTLGRGVHNDINLLEEKASRAHCRVVPEGADIYIEDLKSSNGTKVNGTPVTRQLLKSGDMVVIGRTSIVYDDEKTPAGAVSSGALPVDSGSGAAVSLPGKPQPQAPSAASSAAHRIFYPESALATAVPAGESSIVQANAIVSAGRIVIWTCVLLGAVAVLTFVMLVEPASKQEARTPVPPSRRQPAEPPPPVPQVQTIPDAPSVKTPPPPVPVPAAPVPNTAQQDFDRVMAERDRALSSANFLGARAALASFLAAHPEGALAERIRTELQDTDRLIDSAQVTLLDDARRAIKIRNLRTAVLLCTRVLSSDPRGQYGAAARKLLTSMDETNQARYKEFHAQAVADQKAGRLDAALDTLSKAVDELSGTKWATAISEEQLQVMMAGQMLRGLASEVQKRADAGKPLPFSFPSKKVSGVCRALSGLTLEVVIGENVSTFVSLRTIDPGDFKTLLASVGLSKRNVELAYFWLVIDRKDMAQKEAELALQDPEQASAAARLALQLDGLKTLHVYNFSGWQQQSDWEAVSGSWATQGDRYVLESKEGGETALKPEAIGGVFAARNARISFDFELLDSSPGHVFSFELGKDQKVLTVAFSAEGMTLSASVAGGVSGKAAWPRKLTHADLSVTGNVLSVALDGKPAGQLQAEGLSDISGTLAFRARETTCAIDNVMFRNVEDAPRTPAKDAAK